MFPHFLPFCYYYNLIQQEGVTGLSSEAAETALPRGQNTNSGAGATVLDMRSGAGKETPRLKPAKQVLYH